MGKLYSPASAARAVEEILKMLDGRWKLDILFHLFGGKVQRYSDLEKLIPGISQKMLAQQLRQLEAAGIVVRELFPQVPPRVEYRLTEWGQALCPVLDAMLKWADSREAVPPSDVEARNAKEAQEGPASVQPHRRGARGSPSWHGIA